MRQMTTRILGTALATLVLIASAYANSVTFTPGNIPQPDEQNVLFNTDVTGTTITAHTNHTHDPVNFMDLTTTLMGKGGQAHISAAGGGDIFGTITITAPGHDFADYIFDAHKPNLANDITVNVFLTDGTVATDHFANANHGENFLTIVATTSALIKKITITSSGGFEALDQSRISGVVAAVPEPSSPLLLGIGLLGFAPALRRKKKLS